MILKTNARIFGKIPIFNLDFWYKIMVSDMGRVISLAEGEDKELRKGRLRIKRRQLFKKTNARGHSRVIMHKPDNTVCRTDIDAGHTGIGKQMVHLAVGLRGIWHGQMIGIPETQNALPYLLSCYAEKTEILLR